MQILFNNGNNIEYQAKLNKLLKDIFFDFQFWYDLNLWDDKYECYSIMEDGEIVSNISVFKTRVLLNGKEYSALSLGSVATKQEYRGRGFSRMLMEHILKKYDNTPMYLWANESVVDFYPKFGFELVNEKLPVCRCSINNNKKQEKLEYNSKKVWNYIYNRKNFSSKLDCLNTQSINIFHVHWGYLKDNIYELPEIDTMVIAEKDGTTLKLTGVFSLRSISFTELVRHLPFSDVEKIEFGFMPYWDDLDYVMEDYETGPIFVRGVNCDLGGLKFPELSIT